MFKECHHLSLPAADNDPLTSLCKILQKLSWPLPTIPKCPTPTIMANVFTTSSDLVKLLIVSHHGEVVELH